MRLVFLDTETTGLSPQSGDRIVEIGCVELVDRRATGRNLHLYLNPQRPSHPDALRVHGLTDDFLRDKPLFESIADQLLEFVDGAEVVIHNAGFDTSFLDHELGRLNLPKFANCVEKVTDSLTLARELFPGKSNSLDALCKRLEVDNSNRTLHGALLDAGLLAEVYIRMTRGQKSLVVEVEETPVLPEQVDTVDLSQFTLPVIRSCDEERVGHDALISELEKASKGGAIWSRSVAH
ncbi:MAG: DNA polymerase III subunit epsilon [Burkholderiaceae bacterium]|nr:DNA polymerase III subunit epsilon [Burkholderiaceae bacterium]